MDVCRFDEVEEEFAWVEGEGDRSLGLWREVHHRALGATGDALGIALTPDVEVVCERFALVWAPTQAPTQAGTE